MFSMTGFPIFDLLICQIKGLLISDCSVCQQLDTKITKLSNVIKFQNYSFYFDTYAFKTFKRHN